jgi:hypothetical protein
MEASLSDHFTAEEIASDKHLIGKWIRRKVGVYGVANSKSQTLPK